MVRVDGKHPVLTAIPKFLFTITVFRVSFNVKQVFYINSAHCFYIQQVELNFASEIKSGSWFPFNSGEGDTHPLCQLPFFPSQVIRLCWEFIVKGTHPLLDCVEQEVVSLKGSSSLLVSIQIVKGHTLCCFTAHTHMQNGLKLHSNCMPRHANGSVHFS